MKRLAWVGGFCAAMFAAAPAHAGDASEWVQPSLKMSLSFGSSARACSGTTEWAAGFDLQSTIESREVNLRPPTLDTLDASQNSQAMVGLSSQCGDVRQLRAFGFEVLEFDRVGGR